ncbi:hypothetical protein K1719_045780 [Acacia pycnantha]|nr:hypothetical protein K1719_045780 [Acacia pycnantha]
MIFGHYLTVQPWTPSFRSHNYVVSQVIGWIRLPKLPARYYHKSIIRSIGGVFGEVIKVDYNTESGERGKFARIAVVLDLTKPLISKIMVDGELIFVEYEGLPSICYECGKYGHLQEACPLKTASASGALPKPSMAALPNASVPPQPAPTGGRKAVNGSRYEVLGDVIEEEERQNPNCAQDNIYPSDERVPHRAKVNETKGSKKSSSGTKQKVTALQRKNQDSLFNSQCYVARSSDISLDPNSNSAVRIEDSRYSKAKQANKGVKDGPLNPSQIRAKPTGGNDPLARARGTKISTGVTIHHLGAKPNSKDVGPSIRSIKELARGLQCDLDANDDALQEEGVDFIPA